MELNTQDSPELFTACGGKIKEGEKFPSAEYQGKTVYFCTLACLTAFERNPDLFMAGEIEHPAD